MEKREELRGFVQRKLKRGYPEGELINDLLKQGHSIEEINEALKPLSDDSSNHIDLPLWYFLSAGLVILGLTLLVFPIVWLSEYGWFIFIAGFVGIGLRFFTLSNKK